jgi:hypothetical protein
MLVHRTGSKGLSSSVQPIPVPHRALPGHTAPANERPAASVQRNRSSTAHQNVTWKRTPYESWSTEVASSFSPVV